MQQLEPFQQIYVLQKQNKDKQRGSSHRQFLDLLRGEKDFPQIRYYGVTGFPEPSFTETHVELPNPLVCLQ